MRDILFRGKRVDNGEWVYGYYVKGATRHCIVKSLAQSHIYDVIPESVGQYTGLTDKNNGKKIFEGDIIKYKYDHFIIVFDRTGWDSGVGLTGFALYNKFYGYEKDAETNEEFICADRCIDLRELEVIGNIHDNKELLGEQYE